MAFASDAADAAAARAGEEELRDQWLTYLRSERGGADAEATPDA